MILFFRNKSSSRSSKKYQTLNFREVLLSEPKRSLFIPDPIHILGFTKVGRNFSARQSCSQFRTVVVGDGFLVVINPGPGRDRELLQRHFQNTNYNNHLRLRVSPGFSSGSVSASVALRLFLRIFFRGELLDFFVGDVGVAS